MKVGIAGTGLMGYTHAGCYSELKDAELYAVAEQNTGKLLGFQKKYPAVKNYNDVFEMIDDDSIDVIDICLPTPLHAPVAIAALGRNKNVLLEKPITLNLNDAYAIKDAAEGSKGKLMVAHVLRFWPEYVLTREILLKELAEKKITAVYASRLNELPLWSENSWIMDDVKSGGVIIDLMIHDIDYIIWNFGKARKVFTNAIYNENNYAIQVMVILEMENRCIAYINGGYLNPAGTGLTSSMKIYTENSLLEFNSDKNLITQSQKGGQVKKFQVPEKDAYLEEIKYFLDCIRNNTTPAIITIDDAIESLKTCLTLKESLNKKQWLTINPEKLI